MIKFSKSFYIVLSLLLAISYPVTLFGYEIDIVGSPEFKKQVAQALTLLSEKAPEEYKIVKNNVGRIEEHRISGMLAYNNPPTYQMSLRTAFYSITWCAGTIAHDAYHSKLYHDYKRKYGEPIPYDAWSGFKSEKKCIVFQIAALKKIEAPKREIDYCISLDGTHGDINKDGKIDEEDYKLIDW